MDILSSFSVSNLGLLKKFGIKKDKLGLGDLCDYNHNWNNTGLSLRYKKKKNCYFCHTRNEAGIYKIQCNEHVYIGQSVNISARWHSHLGALRRGTHANNFLQRIYDKYAEESLVFSRLTVLDKYFTRKLSNVELVKVLNSLEQTYFNIYDPDVNFCQIAGNSFCCDRSDDYYDYLSEAKQKSFKLYHPEIGYIEGFNLSKFAKNVENATASGFHGVIRGINMSYKEYFKDEESYLTWKKMKDSYTSKYTGVSLQQGKWKASIYYDGTKKCEYIGLFEDEIDAALAYEQAKIDIMEGVFDGKIKIRKQKLKDKKLSKYTGVTWDKTRKHWKASIIFEGKRRHLGTFQCEYEASLAYKRALEEKMLGIFVPPKPKRSSIYKGVTWVENRKKWAAHAWANKKSVYLGYFQTELEAHHAYKTYMTNLQLSA